MENESHADPTQAQRAKKVVRVARRKTGENDEFPNASSLHPPPASAAKEATQFVSSVEEGNALVKRLRQLESENAALANTLSKVCDENAQLATRVAELEKKCAAMSQSPLSSTSILRSLFEPEKTGWFGGSKSAARDNLEQLAEALQNEFTAYCASHASTNDEVLSLIAELQNAHGNVKRLSDVVHAQQEAMSHGQLAVAVRVLQSGETEADSVSIADLRREVGRRAEREEELAQELRRAKEEAHAKATQVARMQQELRAALEGGQGGANAFGETQRQQMDDTIARLEGQLAELQDAFRTKEHLYSIKAAENESLSSKLRVAENSASSSLQAATCTRCEELQRELEAKKQELVHAGQTTQRLEQRLGEARQVSDRQVEVLKQQLGQQQRSVTELEAKLQQSVHSDEAARLEAKIKSLEKELEIAGMRSTHLEQLVERERTKSSSNETASGSASAAVGGTGASVASTLFNSNSNNNNPSNGGFGSLDEVKVLETLERNKERITRLEFQRDQLSEEGRRLSEALNAKDEELRRVSRTAQEDKQRITFLLKRAATITSELNDLTSTNEGLTEAHEKAQRELSELRRKVEEVPTLHQRIDEMRQKHESLQQRLSSVEELENELVKAKETIAYMELAQSETINISQYAELQSKNSKLENTLGPIKKQLEDIKKEMEQLKTENESLHAVLTRQKNQITTHEETLSSLNGNDAKLRERANQLTTENTRLKQLNTSLEQQMENMQDGIKEMAVKLEQERARAKSAAETQYRGEIEKLQQKLAHAKDQLEGVKSSQNQFVPEAIHKSIVVEKERVEEESKRKTFDLDKLKSEILIYRQTIDDLEAENEEHVRQIETLQATHQKERGSQTEKLTAEQKKSTETMRELESLRSRMKETTQRSERDTTQLREMEEAAQKHRRAFEDKCRSEEKLIATIAATNAEMETLRQELERLRSTKKELEVTIAAAAAVPPPLAAAAAAAAHTDVVAVSAMEEPSKAVDPSFYHKTSGASNAMMPHVPNTSDPATLRAQAEQLQMTLIQVQQQLVEQKNNAANNAATLNKALEKSNMEATRLRERVQELEAELSCAGDGQTPLDMVTPSPEAPGKTKKKKAAKKSLSSLAKANEGLEVNDVLAVGAAGVDMKQLSADCAEAQEAARLAKEELETLRAENKELQASVERLHQDLQNAYEDLEMATSHADETSAELKQQIRFLESQLKAPGRSGTPNCDNDNRFRTLTEENKRLHSQIELLKGNSANPSLPPPVPTGSSAEKTQEELRRKDAELAALARELVPVKNKLVEYMAMADRLGIQYPFSAAMEGAAVLRLKAMHFDSVTGRARANSAPRPFGENGSKSGSFRGKKTTAGGGAVTKKRKKKKEVVQVENDSDLR